MDFSYLDKKEYGEIPLLDEAAMTPRSEKDRFFIRKYTVREDNDLLHRHKYIQINYVYRGSGYHCVNQSKSEIVKGDIFIIPPYVPHVIRPRSDVPLEIFEFEFTSDFVLPSIKGAASGESYFDFAYLEPFMRVEEEVKPRFNLSEELRHEAESILWEVKGEYEAERAGYDLIARALLLKLLVIVGRAFSEDIKGTETEAILKRYKDIAKTVSEYIEAHYAEELTLEHIAQQINYSKSYFCYLFKAVTGKTYVEYLGEVRVRRAAELLHSTEGTVAEIAFAVGFKTVANFNKYFKEIMGMTPSAYRKRR